MKTLLAICIFSLAPFVSASAPAAAPPVSTGVSGEVLEAKDVESYTYLRLKTKDGETWAAVSRAPVKIGARVTLENVTVMKDFESRSLKQTFPTILFGSLAGAAAGQPGAATARVADTADIKVPKAGGPNARTVEEIVTKRAELKDKPVLVRGRIVKYNAAIMGKNWIHLRDGSGSAANDTNDLTVTTASQAKVGDVVTVKGIVRADKDFGSGYSYKVLVEDATLQP
ncbi:nucleotide-binding protein [Sulfurisoma sediminicola]|uniref:Nucleotide-binding protein n=1 Tax=Sulfurisoma sediminicola TaxID=1381557 RepID=A0A497XJW3_9PROT|nr:nucleotide-binding protein [Sulfurisoma sediminicola]RLJ67650.1 hypothetical protein DFR35_0199 [Sulfurisoma sediminicola]